MLWCPSGVGNSLQSCSSRFNSYPQLVRIRRTSRYFQPSFFRGFDKWRCHLQSLFSFSALSPAPKCRFNNRLLKRFSLQATLFSSPNIIRTLTPTVSACLVNAVPTLRITKRSTLTHKTLAVHLICAEFTYRLFQPTSMHLFRFRFC
jgi:hypothetical protein